MISRWPYTRSIFIVYMCLILDLTQILLHVGFRRSWNILFLVFFFHSHRSLCMCVFASIFFPVSFHQIKLFSFLLANLLHNWILFHRKMPTIVCTIYIKYDDTYWQHRVQLICKTEKNQQQREHTHHVLCFNLSTVFDLHS